MSNTAIYDRIVDYLLRSGDVRPGDRVVETQLAARLGVSRIPVRESLGRLRGQGLLVTDGRGRGLRLRRYALDEIMACYDYREALEGAAARAAARAATPSDLERLDDAIARGVAEIARGGFEGAAWQQADHDFHAALADAGHSERITQALKQVLTEMHGVFYGDFHNRLARARGRMLSRHEAEQRGEASLEEHRSLVAAIRDGNRGLAERLARRHVRIAARRVRSGLKSLDRQPRAAARNR